MIDMIGKFVDQDLAMEFEELVGFLFARHLLIIFDSLKG